MKKSAERNKIWPAASQSLLKWPDMKHLLARPSTSAAWHNHHRLREAEKEQAQVTYYPPPTTPHHHYMMISRSSSMSDMSSGGHHQMSSREYWDARRVFLSSYSFTSAAGKKADGGPVIVLAAAAMDVEWLKGKGKMWAKEVKEAAAGFGRYVAREVKRRRVVLKGCRLTFALPSFVVVRMRCVTPWITTRTPAAGLPSES